jgi:hypothetical protein
MAANADPGRISWMLQLIAPELERWITALDAWPTDVSIERRRDPHQQFRVLIDEWHRTFYRHLGPSERNYVFELLNVRNRWAHHDPFTPDDVWRALDTAERLMRAIGADEATSALETAKRADPAAKRAPGKPMSADRDRPPRPPPAKRAAGASEQSIADLPPTVVEPARRELSGLVSRAGGEQGRKQIQVGDVEVLADLFDAWARYHGTAEPGGGIWFGPKPGLWHALQGVVPIDDTNRWDSLRKDVVKHLEAERGWQRQSPPRGSRFFIPAR